MKLKRIFKYLGIFIGIFLVTSIILGGIGAATPYLPNSRTNELLKSTDNVTVSTEKNITSVPKNFDNQTAIIFYPGSRVDPKAYSPIFEQLAEKGIMSIIVPIPLNLAVLNTNAADSVLKDYPNVKNWYISGHSLGVTMVIKYLLSGNIEKFKGLILMASYPDKNDDLSKNNLKVLSLKGSLDGLVKRETFESTKSLLPNSTVFKIIEGGNHAQFGSYGKQDGDGVATINEEAQQKITLTELLKFLSV